MWKDYKNKTKRMEQLQKDSDAVLAKLAKPAKPAGKPILKTRPVRIALVLVPVLAVVGLFVFIPTLFGNRSGAKEYTKSSFIGETKAMEELAGIGGAEISPSDRNTNELSFYFYKVKQGESISAISQKLGVTMDTILSLNTMDNAHNISEGQRIIVPNLEGILYTVKKGDSIDQIAKKYAIANGDIHDANDIGDDSLKEGSVLFLPGARLSDADRAKILGYLFMKPFHGRYTSGFGIRRDPFTGGTGYHAGIDIAGPIGSPVISAKEGTVEVAGWYGGYGKCVIIRHQFGYETVYGHLSSVNVKEGSYVKAGQFIARLGNTGRSTGPHLHFEVRKWGRPTNPTRLAGLSRNGSWY